jgi:hypothetical protein
MRSLEVGPNDVDEFTCGGATIFASFPIEDVRVEMLLENFRHQAVHGAPSAGNQLERLTTAHLALERPFYRFALPLDSPDACQQFCLVSDSMAHFRGLR